MAMLATHSLGRGIGWVVFGERGVWDAGCDAGGRMRVRFWLVCGGQALGVEAGLVGGVLVQRRNKPFWGLCGRP